MIEENLDQIIKLVESGTGEAVAEYTKWYFVEAITWVSIGVLGLLLGVTCSYLWFVRDNYFDDAPLLVIAIIMVIISVCTIGNNMANIFEPQAYAIHTLISDIRG